MNNSHQREYKLMRLRHVVFAALLAIGAAIQPASAQDKSIVVASTTSTQDSGLFGFILPKFKAKTGIDVKVIAQGTGQALDTGRRGDADVVFVHAKAQEDKFVADGFGVKRFPVMYNDFVLVGPKSDPAGIMGGKDIIVGLKTISGKDNPFVSRGDKSGTHAAELNLWPLRSRNLDLLQEQGRPPNCGGRRQAPLQSVRHHACEPHKTRPREDGPGTSLHRLGRVR
jgi:tungstate transport system substrate-binding protein